MGSKSNPKSVVLSYLTAQNRPYSTNDVVSNLHNEHSKAAVQRALDLLVAEGAVREKLNGKQKAYVINQSGMAAADEGELADLEKRVKEAEEEAAQKKLAADKAEGYVKGMSALPVTKEVLAQIKELEKEVEAMQAKVETLSSKTDLVDKAEVRKLEKARDEAVQVKG